MFFFIRGLDSLSYTRYIIVQLIKGDLWRAGLLLGRDAAELFAKGETLSCWLHLCCCDCIIDTIVPEWTAGWIFAHPENVIFITDLKWGHFLTAGLSRQLGHVSREGSHTSHLRPQLIWLEFFQLACWTSRNTVVELYCPQTHCTILVVKHYVSSGVVIHSGGNIYHLNNALQKPGSRAALWA